MSDKSICCLELTSSGLKLVIGYMLNGNVYILHALGSTRSKLIKGVISDSEEMRISVQELISSASKTLGMKIESVVLGLPSIDTSIVQGTSETNTTDPSSHITHFDGSNCLHMIVKQKVDTEGRKKVIDVVPYKYAIDGNKIFNRFPLGESSLTLSMSADVEITSAVLNDTFVKAVNDAGLRIDKVVNTTNAAIKYITSFQKAQQEFIFIDFGARLTTLGYSYDGRLLKADTLFFGSDDITDAIAKKFNVDFKTANSYKEIYGLSKNPDFEFKTKEGASVKDICQTISDSLTPLTDAISQFEMGIDSNARNLFIISGGGADLLGLSGFLSTQFQNRVLMFTPPCFGARDKSFTNCVSMLMYFSSYELKNSPTRPVDLTLTRMVPTTSELSKDGPLKRQQEDEEDKEPKLTSSLNDEIL